jgi:O-antigen/teichoic acid export membrane protein/LysM repeat protein
MTPPEAISAPGSPARRSQSEQFFRTDAVRADLGSRTVRGGMVTALSQGVKQLLSIGSIIILSRLLTPEETGLVAMVLVISGLMNMLNDMGLAGATIQRPEINQAQVSALFWINAALGLALTLLTIACAPLIALFYGQPELTMIMIVLSINFVCGGLSVQHRALLRRQMHFTALGLIEVVSMLVCTVAAVVIALPPIRLGYWSLVVLNMQYPIMMLGTWLACRWMPSRVFWADDVRDMVTFGLNLTGFRVATYAARNVDNLLIGKFFGPVALGLYTRAYSLLLLPLGRINEPVAAVAVPALSRLTDQPERYQQAYRRIVSTLCVVTMPLVAFMVGAADWLVLVLLGPQWIDSSYLFVLLGVSGLIEPFTYTLSWLYTSQARTAEQFRYGIYNTILTLLSILAGLPWGPTGVAAAYGICGLLIRTPLAFAMAGRAGPVKVRDLYALSVPYLRISTAIMVALLGYRLIAVASPLANFLIAAVITAVVTLVMMALTVSGRQTLGDMLHMAAQAKLVPERKRVVRRIDTPPITAYAHVASTPFPVTGQIASQIRWRITSLVGGIGIGVAIGIVSVVLIRPPAPATPAGATPVPVDPLVNVTRVPASSGSADAPVQNAGASNAATSLPTAATSAAGVPAPATKTAASPLGAPGGFIEYTVQQGDILKELEERFQVPVSVILANNEIANPESLVVGQVLRIPQATAVSAANGGFLNHTVVAGDTLFELAQRYSVSVEAILAANEIPNPESLNIGQVLRVPRGISSGDAAQAAPPNAPTAVPVPYVEYTVQPGDILFRIAQRQGVAMEEIIAINDIPNPESLVVGQVLRIPRQP